MKPRVPYGWKDFDPEVVFGFAAGHLEFMVRDRAGWMTCPLVGHRREQLSWQDGNHRKGAVAHGDPAVSFRVSPTYVLSDPLDNFVTGHTLVGEMLTGVWGKAETYRLGNEHSEDALTWNVFHGL